MPVTIGFEGEVDNGQVSEVTEEKKQEVIEKAKRVMIKIPQKRIPEILKGFDCVVVNSFGDDYHLSDEEREKRNKFAKDAKKLRKMKRIYRRLDEYVVAMREHLKFLDVVAEGNGVYDPEEFKVLFFKGKINIVGMKFPKYKGPNRKEVNYKYLAEFILSDANPDEIIPKWQRSDYEDEDPEELRKRLFTDEELDYVLSPLTEEEGRFEFRLFDPDEDEQDGTNVAVMLSNKECKKLTKAQPELMAKIKEMKRERRTVDRLSDAFLHNSIAEDISEIAKYDQNYGYVSSDDVPEFKGDILNDKDYYTYMRKLQEFEDKHTYVNYHGKDKTLEEVKELEFKEILEREGWNIRAFAENREQEKKLKRIQKRDKKKEKQLKKHLMELQKRRESRENGDSSYKDFKKSKKKKKNKKDNIKERIMKKEKRSKKESKDVHEVVERTKEDFKQLLLNEFAPEGVTSFKEYEERALDLTNLFGGDDDE